MISGTSEYAQGLVEHVTVLVGVAIGQKAVGGVIHQPYYKSVESDILGRTLWGINGVGYGGFTPIAPPKGKRIIAATRYDLVLKYLKPRLLATRNNKHLYCTLSVHIRMLPFRQP